MLVHNVVVRWGKKTSFNTFFKRLSVEEASDRARERHHGIKRVIRIVSDPIQIGDQSHESVRTNQTETRIASIEEIIRFKASKVGESEAVCGTD